MARRPKNIIAVSPCAFAWDRAQLAVLRHSTLAFGCELDVVPLSASFGMRERLSLVAQFAAHQALLRFGGIADTDFAADEWRVVRKRGSDCRLVRVGAKTGEAPPVLTVIQQCADALGAPKLDVLRQSSGRAEAVYAEIHRRLRDDIAADLRWMQSAAAGAIAAPGADALRAAWAGGKTDGVDLDALRLMQDDATTLVILGGGSPLRRYSAIEPLAEFAGPLAKRSEAEIAERVIVHCARRRIVFATHGAFDPPSRRVVEILEALDGATWITIGGSARPFVIAPTVALQRELEQRPIDVSSADYAALLDHGTLAAALDEPKRSYIGALALLGRRIPRDAAEEFLRELLFAGELEELVVDGITSIEGDSFVVHTSVAAPASLEIVAADHLNRAAERLEATRWKTAEETIEALRDFPRNAMTAKLADKLASALIDCGRYRAARELTANPLLLARADRRTGEYATALARLEGLDGDDAATLRGELLCLLGRHDEVALPQSAVYQRAIVAFEANRPFDEDIEDRYDAARFATYQAIARNELELALDVATLAITLARTVIERIDATLDRLFVLFTLGRWRQTRTEALEALALIDETEGDRAAGGILFTLAFLAADDGQWVHAAHQLERLRQFYGGTSDALRARELDLIAAHLDFSRGRFDRARDLAASALDAGLSAQLREAASLILDEIDRIDGRATPLRSKGLTANLELTRRHNRLRGLAPDSTPLERFRGALMRGDHVTAQRLAGELQIELELPSAVTSELHMLRAAATRPFPFGPHDLGPTGWRYATRNRLGHWSESGSLPPLAPAELDRVVPGGDWLACGERELLFIDGVSRWPAESREAIAALFRTRAENQRLRRILEQDEAEPSRTSAPDGLVGDSPAMAGVYATIARVAKRDVAVCILGESGTGKELVARAMHRQSPRRFKLFTAVNCAALPENLIESELFGHVRGAFTGADRDRAGLIETTDGGTLFLDEIGEMPLAAQAKLLRFLQEGEFRRVGDTVNRTADVRIVSATNRKLDAAVDEGRFREDLYYRIRGVEVALPPLRERGGDVLALASHFLGAEREKHRSGASSFAPDVEAIFASYAWPGNVRELQNTIRAAHALAGDARAIEVEHLPERLRRVRTLRAVPGSYQEAVARFRRELIEKSLAAVNGNQNRAASLLRMSRQALAYQIRELGIMPGAVNERPQPRVKTAASHARRAAHA
jgi:DNA-binding NtrC family response regulator